MRRIPRCARVATEAGHAKNKAGRFPGPPNGKYEARDALRQAASCGRCDTRRFPVGRTRTASCHSFRCRSTDLRQWTAILTCMRRLRKDPVAIFFNKLRPVFRGGVKNHHSAGPAPGNRARSAPSLLAYLTIFATTPAPTVRPPSRIANRRPSSIATGLMRDTTIFTLSPGITISTPSGSSQAPVMSVVRK